MGNFKSDIIIRINYISMSFIIDNYYLPNCVCHYILGRECRMTLLSTNQGVASLLK